VRKSEGKQLVSSQVHCWQEVSQTFGAPVGAAVCPGASAGASAELSSQQPELICFVLPPPSPCPPVIDGLDLLKKEHPGARDGIRYLEAEFKKGNR